MIPVHRLIGETFEVGCHHIVVVALVRPEVWTVLVRHNPWNFRHHGRESGTEFHNIFCRNFVVKSEHDDMSDHGELLLKVGNDAKGKRRMFPVGDTCHGDLFAATLVP
jgi:hypothetical protein